MQLEYESVIFKLDLNMECVLQNRMLLLVQNKQTNKNIKNCVLLCLNTAKT